MTQTIAENDAALHPEPTSIGLAVQLDPDTVLLNLLPRPPETDSSALWRPVWPLPRTVVTIAADSDRVRLVRLTARGASAGFRAEWIRWSYAVRKAPELAGGEAVTAHDALSEDRSALTLMVLPGETREAALEFHAWLDAGVEPGRYMFNIVVEEADGGEIIEVPGAMWIQHPPPRYLDDLPAIYGEAMAKERDANYGNHQPPFFERFLRGFEDAREPMHEMLANLDQLFAAFRAPRDLVPWLATWVALVLDENWSEMKRRRLIQEAVDLYRWRGTRRGLARYLEIYAGVAPDINDNPFEGMRLGASALLGQRTILGDVRPHCFVVTLALPYGAAVKEHIVRAIIEAEKPAHTAYDLRIVRAYSTTD